MDTSNIKQSIKLIQKVLATKTKVKIGEPYKIKVKTNPEIKEEIHVSINGVLGREQILQFAGPPRVRRILITASTKAKIFDFKIIEVEILEENECNKIPIINVGNYYEQENCILLKADIEKEYKNCFFEWDFGNSLDKKPIKIYSEKPETIFCYENYLDNSNIYQTFHLKLTIHNRDTETKTIAEKSFTVHNLYAIEKNRGILKPRIKYDYHLLHDDHRLKGSCNITNLEGESLFIEQRQIEFLYNDPEKLSYPNKPEYFENRFSKLISRLTIEPFQTKNIDCSIPFNYFPKDCFGYAVHFKGKTESGYVVFASAYFEFQTNYKNSFKIRDKYLLSILNEFRNNVCKKNKDVISLNELQKHLTNKSDLKEKSISSTGLFNSNIIVDN